MLQPRHFCDRKMTEKSVMRCPDFRGCDVGCLGQPNVVPFGIMVRMRIKSHASLFKSGRGSHSFCMHRLDLKGMAGRLLLVFTLVLLLQAVHCSNSTGKSITGTDQSFIKRTLPSSTGISIGEDSGCYELTPPFYGVLVYNGSWIRGKNQPQWRENDTVTFLCDRGYELVRPSGASLGETWSVTCQASDAGSGSAEEETSSNGYSGTAWSGEPEQFRCTSKPVL